jgi:diguanylate cyclase (GGDEF)-like protein
MSRLGAQQAAVTRGRRIAARGRLLRLGLASCLGLLVATAEVAEPTPLGERYTHRSWRRRDGLPGNSVFALAQAQDGSLWIGTESGLARFDGHHFRAYGEVRDEVFDSRFVKALVAGRDGTLWAGTERGLLALRDGEWRRDPAPGRLGADASVTALAEDSHGDLWIGTRAGLLRRDAASGQVILVGLGDTLVTELLATGSDEVWVGSASSGVWRAKAGVLAPVALDARPQEEAVSSLVEGEDGSVLVITPVAVRLFRRGIQHPRPADSPLFGLREVAAAASGGGRLWLGTRNRGPLEVASGEVSSVEPAHPLANAMVHAVLVADDGTVWFGTAGDGLHQLTERIGWTLDRRVGLPTDATVSVVVDGDGTIWAGSIVGLTRLTPSRASGFTAHQELTGSPVLVLLRSRAGELWASTRDGLARREREQWQVYRLWSDSASRSISALFEDRSGNLWVGTSSGLGVSPGGESVRFASVAGFETMDVNAIAGAGDGSLWIGTRGSGLLRLNGTKVETVLAATEASIVSAILQETSGDTWVGTFEAGLFHQRAGRWHRFDLGKGLPDDSVRQIQEDANGDLWICSASGVSRLVRSTMIEVEDGRRSTLVSIGYGPTEGIADGVCHGAAEPGAVRTADGLLWFATHHGLVRVHPERVDRPLPRRVPYLETFSGDGKELPQASWGSKQILPGGLRRLDLHFSAASLVAHRKVGFRYRLLGFDRDWLIDGGERRARYTNLPPARYRFEIAQGDGYGGWEAPRQVAEFEIEPLLHQRTSFRGLLILAGVAAALLAYRLRERHLCRRAAALETLVRQRTEELREANARLEGLSATDPLTGLANRRRLEEVLETEIRRSARNEREISLMLVDIDHFKRYNDTFGHLGGDDCLRRVASILATAVRRPGDLAARYGGEEFAIVWPETSAGDALRLAESLRRKIEGLGLPHPASSVASCVTISSGVAALVPPVGFGPADLIADADQALYRAKESGRNRVEPSARLAAAGAKEALYPALRMAGRPAGSAFSQPIGDAA